MGERRLCKPEVIGSSPFTSTKAEVIALLKIEYGRHGNKFLVVKLLRADGGCLGSGRR